MREKYQLEPPTIVVEQPPSTQFGEYALPLSFELAKKLRKPPRKIAEEIVAGLGAVPGFEKLEVAGAGYINARVNRGELAATLAADGGGAARAGKVIVEHTNINPNKAAHIGHLRNAVLGDVLASCLRSLGHAVEVQNYIDDTGVQLADVVVGFRDLRRLSLAEVAALPEPFDYLCWDLYAEVRRWYDADAKAGPKAGTSSDADAKADPNAGATADTAAAGVGAGGADTRAERRALVRDTLHQLETGRGERAEIGRLVARRVVHRHLATMRRLGVSYDLLTRESDILALHFFDRAFLRLKDSGAVRLEAAGKNAGCWVMPLQHSEEFAGMEDPDKVIMRSDGTVTYVGKDIAYQLWKFGLLGQDFGYRQASTAIPDGHEVLDFC